MVKIPDLVMLAGNLYVGLIKREFLVSEILNYGIWLLLVKFSSTSAVYLNFYGYVGFMVSPQKGVTG